MCTCDRGCNRNIFCHMSKVARVSHSMGGILAIRKDVSGESVRTHLLCVSSRRRRQARIRAQGRKICTCPKVRDPLLRRASRAPAQSRFISEAPQTCGFRATFGLNHQLQGPGSGPGHRGKLDAPACTSRANGQGDHAPLARRVPAWAHPQRLEVAAFVCGSPNRQPAGRGTAGQRAQTHQPANEQGDERPHRAPASHANADVRSALFAPEGRGCLRELRQKRILVGTDDRDRPELGIGDALTPEGLLDSLPAGPISILKDVGGMKPRGFVQRRIPPDVRRAGDLSGDRRRTVRRKRHQPWGCRYGQRKGEEFRVKHPEPDRVLMVEGSLGLGAHMDLLSTPTTDCQGATHHHVASVEAIPHDGGDCMELQTWPNLCLGVWVERERR